MSEHHELFRAKEERDSFRRVLERVTKERNALAKALRDVLEVGRGTSGRLILELPDEDKIRDVLSRIGDTQ